MVRMVSYFPDFGRSVIRSTEMYWKGPSSACVSNSCKGALLLWLWTAYSNATVRKHPRTYLGIPLC